MVKTRDIFGNNIQGLNTRVLFNEVSLGPLSHQTENVIQTQSVVCEIYEARGGIWGLLSTFLYFSIL